MTYDKSQQSKSKRGITLLVLPSQEGGISSDLRSLAAVSVCIEFKTVPVGEKLLALIAQTIFLSNRIVRVSNSS